jgi:hypothetical protein
MKTPPLYTFKNPIILHENAIKFLDENWQQPIRLLDVKKSAKQ